MKANKIIGATALSAAAICAVIAYGEPKAILTASQLGVEDLDLDFGLDAVEENKTTDTIEVPEIEVPAVEEVAVEVPAVEAPAVEVPAVEEVAVEVPAVEAPAVEVPAVEEVAVEVPAVEEVAIEVPAVEEVAVETPAVEEVAVEVPAVEEVAVEAPAVEEVAVEVPAVEEVAVEAPAVEEVAVEVPAVEEVAVEAPAVEEVAVEAPAVAKDAIDLEIDDILSLDTPVAEAPAAEVKIEEAPAAVEEAKVVEAAPAAVEEVAAPVAEEVVAEVAAPVAEASTVVAEAAPEAPTAELDPLAKEASEIAMLERSRREVFVSHGRDLISQAQDNLRVGNWTTARDKFMDALRFLPDKADTHADIEAANAGIAESWYRIAQEQFEKRSFEEAEKSCREARAYGHEQAEQLIRDIRNFQVNPPPPPVVEHVKRSKQASYVQGREDIKRRIQIAREYMAVGEYSDAQATLELILRDHPWCPEALRDLRRLHRQVTKYSLNEREITRDKMIKDVVRAWTPNEMYGIDYTSGDVHVSNQDTQTSNVGAELTAEMRIRDKMRRIVIPEIDFRQANITDVITFLGDASREYDDADVAAEERGINFVLDLGEAAVPTAEAEPAAASDDPWGAPAEPVAEANTSGISAITMKTRYVSLLSTLETIMGMSGLKYRIEGNLVMIMPKNKAEGELIHRMYNVLPSIGDRITSIGSGKTEGSGDSGDPFTMSSGSVETTTDWKGFFAKLGVNWPDDSSVTYMPSIGKLVVKNTATNLATLEQVLGALNVTPFQVEIEVRFVEVAQKDLNSLGLEWILNDDWEIAHNKGDSDLHPQSRRRITMSAGSINSGFNYLSNNSKLAINGGTAIADNIATFSSILTNPELSLVLHALSNRSNADLLSAPKVVAMNGSQATIKTVTEYIYPTEYDVEMLESEDDDGNSSYSGAVVEPQTFVTREVGVILQVTPRVSSDGTRIGLDLTPSVVSEPTWKNYGSVYPSSIRDGTDLLGMPTYKTEYVQLTMEQPFFPVRSLATSVEIYNGSTVVMGGMIQEERYTEEDKIPILGDIPLLGRLFRYSYDQSDKKNLLIFVTARLVDPAGRKVNSSSDALLKGAEAN